jgi:uncharacterized protein Veg
MHASMRQVYDQEFSQIKEAIQAMMGFHPEVSMKNYAGHSRSPEHSGSISNLYSTEKRKETIFIRENLC